MKFTGLIFVLLTLSGFAADGTTFQEQAARLQNINAYLLDYRPASAPDKPTENQFRFSLDLTPQPDVNTRVGDKEEPIDPPSVVPRLRLGYGFKSGLVVSGTYVPGVEYEDYETDMFSLDLGYRFQLGRYQLAARASYSDGEVQGPITDSQINDDFSFTNQGFDLSLGRKVKRFNLYAFVGMNDIETTLDVNADGSHLENTDDAVYGGLGGSVQFGRLVFTLEQNFTDDYLQHVVLNVGYRF